MAVIADDQKAMEIIGLTAQEQTSIFRVLATILWLGNVQFVEGDDGNAVISDPGVADFVAYLMNTDSASVQKALLTRIMETQRGGRRGEQKGKLKAYIRLRVRSPTEHCTGIGQP